MIHVTVNVINTTKRLIAGGLIFRECAEHFGVNEATLRTAYNRWEAAEKARASAVVGPSDADTDGEVEASCARQKITARDRDIANCIGPLLDLRAAYPAGVPIAKGEHAKPRMLTFV